MHQGSKGLVFFFILFSLFISIERVEARTYPAKGYDQDQNSNWEYLFEPYEESQDYPEYEDPHFEEALPLPSPLYNPLYQTYDVIVVVNKTDIKISGTELKEPAQTARVYVRPEALERVGLNRVELNPFYNPSIGLLFFWKVSTARPGHSTPGGFFIAQSFSSDHYSSLYNNASMPWAVFFNGNIATHGVKKGSTANPVAHLGSPASAGCVRLEPQRARDLFHLIGQTGMGLVDRLDNKSGSPIIGRAGETLQVQAYKTLIIIKD